MKRVVRNKITRAFLDANGGWADDFESARRFEDVKSVMEACAEHGLTDVELVLVMGSQPSAEYDIDLPLCTNGSSVEGGRT